MSKRYQQGFAPIILVILFTIIGASSFLVIKNIPFNQPQPTPDKGFQASNSAQVQISLSPSPSASQIKSKFSPTPTKKTTPSPTSTSSNSSNNSSGNNQNNNSDPTSTPTQAPAATNTPTPPTTSGYANSYISVDKLTVSATLSRANASGGRIYGSGVSVTSINAYSIDVINQNPTTSGIGMEYFSGGLLPNQSTVVRTNATLDHSNGVYTGEAVIYYYDQNSNRHTGPTVNYTITLTD